MTSIIKKCGEIRQNCNTSSNCAESYECQTCDIKLSTSSIFKIKTVLIKSTSHMKVLDIYKNQNIKEIIFSERQRSLKKNPAFFKHYRITIRVSQTTHLPNL